MPPKNYIPSQGWCQNAAADDPDLETKKNGGTYIPAAERAAAAKAAAAGHH